MDRRAFLRNAAVGFGGLGLRVFATGGTGALGLGSAALLEACTGPSGPATTLSDSAGLHAVLLEHPRSLDLANDRRGGYFEVHSDAHTVLCYDAFGVPRLSLGGVPGAVLGQLNLPLVAARRAGEILVLEQGNARVQRFDQAGRSLGVLADRSVEKGGLLSARDLAVRADGVAYVADAIAGRVLVVDASGRALGSLGEAGPSAARLALPTSVALAQDGTVYVCDAARARIVAFDEFGQWKGAVATASEGLVRPFSVRVLDSGLLAVADRGAARLVVIEASGRIVEVVPTRTALGDTAAPMSLSVLGDGSLGVTLARASFPAA